MTTTAPGSDAVQPGGNAMTSDYRPHPGVDAYLATLPDWQHDLCGELRALIHAAVPQIEEPIKRRVRPYFILDGHVCALLACKDHVNLFVYDGVIVPDPDHIITGGHHNKAARMISFYRDSTIPRGPLATMLQHIAANNRAGG